jgi:hypothetical protein
MATPPTQPQPYPAAPQAESHLWDYVHVLLRRRRVVLAISTAVFAPATLRALLTRPVFGLILGAFHYYGHYYGHYGQPPSATPAEGKRLPGGAKVAQINEKRARVTDPS